jgi:UTP--glucose-1-phosphate uridylyltransferase
MAKEVVGDEPFFMCWGDEFIESRVPIARQLIDAYARYKSSVVGVMAVPEEKFHKYGMMRPYDSKKGVANKTFRIKGIIEKPVAGKSPSKYAMMGGAVFTPEIFRALEKAKPSLGGEIYYVDGVNILTRRERVYAHQITGKWWDTGSKAEYIKANIHFALQHKDLRDSIRAYIRKPY